MGVAPPYPRLGVAPPYPRSHRLVCVFTSGSATGFFVSVRVPGCLVAIGMTLNLEAHSLPGKPIRFQEAKWLWIQKLPFAVPFGTNDFFSHAVKSLCGSV